MTVHLQGLGVVGSLLAHRLKAERIPFTWHDTDEQFTAWQACTGSVYPTADEYEYENYCRWHVLLLDDLHNLSRYVEQGQWCYNSVAPPHGGAVRGVRAQQIIAPVTISDATTIQFDMQSLVRDTRNRFASREVLAPRKRDLVIVTHGSAQAETFVWGWSALVRLAFSDEMAAACAELSKRPVFYLRQVYDMSYLYPKPGRDDLWYGGTATISQRTPKQLDVQAHYKRWKAKVRERSGGHVEVAGGLRGSLSEGWRPKAATELPLVAWKDEQTLLCRPMGGNGVRFFPTLSDAILEEL